MRYEIAVIQNQWFVLKQGITDDCWTVHSVHDHKENAVLIVEALEARERNSG